MGLWNIAISVSVCLSVCFIYMLTVAVARSSSDGLAIRYVLPILVSMSCFSYNGASGPESKLKLMSSLPVGHQTILFGRVLRWWHQLGGESCRLWLHLVLISCCIQARNVLKSIFLDHYRNFKRRRLTRVVMAEERPWRSQVHYHFFLVIDS